MAPSQPWRNKQVDSLVDLMAQSNLHVLPHVHRDTALECLTDGMAKIDAMAPMRIDKPGLVSHVDSGSHDDTLGILISLSDVKLNVVFESCLTLQHIPSQRRGDRAVFP